MRTPTHLLVEPRDRYTLCGRRRSKEGMPHMLVGSLSAYQERLKARGDTTEVCADCFVAAANIYVLPPMSTAPVDDEFVEDVHHAIEHHRRSTASWAADWA